jgi:two-component system cell cycle sensor histidine kinase/response regulator CckA
MASPKKITKLDPTATGDSNSIPVRLEGAQTNQSEDVPVPVCDARNAQTLEASELKYRRLFEAAKDGILILDAGTGRITDVNPFLFKLLNFTRDDMVGKTVGELSPFKDIESNKVMLGRLQKDGYVRYEDLPLKTRDGQHIDVEFVCNVYAEGDKNVIQCNIRDVTEKKVAEKELSRLAAIIEYSNDAIVSKSAQGIVIGWNHGAERLYGYKAEEIMGRSISLLFPPDHYQEYLQIMKKVRNGEAVPLFDTVRRKKDGSLINVSIGLTPIEAYDGEVVGASQISHDITRIKKLETQFIEAQKMEVIGQLAGGVAHDFNNILGVIMGYNGLMISELGANNPMLIYMEEIRHASERAVGLTRQLLVFSSRQTVQPVVLDLNEVVKDLNKMLVRLLAENIEMTIVPGKDIGRIKADPGYVGQVLMNLAVNARDAMPNGGKLTITTGNVTFDKNQVRPEADAAPGNYVLLSVVDTGTGMTDEVKAHLFEAFFTTKPKGKGTGLGLTTCQTIVQQSGGHIVVHSQLDQGTTFKIYFPRVDEPLDNVSPLVLSGPEPRGTETVLLVEDDSAVRHLACNILERQGYKVLCAINGQDGLRVARERKDQQISLVITDIVMPLMSGKVMVKWLRETYPGLKILFTSGYNDEIIFQQDLDKPGIAYLPKPYTPAILTYKVREMLDSKNDESGVTATAK